MDTNQLTVPAKRGGDRFDTQFLSRQSTKVVIQEIPTRRYWGNGGFWTADIEKATTFRSCSAALENATQLKLPNVQLVLTREFKEYEIIPLKTSIRA